MSPLCAPAQETGLIPNTYANGLPKSIFATPEAPVAIPSQAESRYGIGSLNPSGATPAPKHVITGNPDGVQFDYASFNGEPGAGVEMTTKNPIPVLNVQRIGATPTPLSAKFYKQNAGALGAAVGVSALMGVGQAAIDYVDEWGKKAVLDAKTPPADALTAVNYLIERNHDDLNYSFLTNFWHLVTGSTQENVQKHTELDASLKRVQQYWNDRQQTDLLPSSAWLEKRGSHPASGQNPGR